MIQLEGTYCLAGFLELALRPLHLEYEVQQFVERGEEIGAARTEKKRVGKRSIGLRRVEKRRERKMREGVRAEIARTKCGQ